MRIAMMLYAGVQLLQVTGPMEVFHEANRLHGGVLYEAHLIGPAPGPVVSSNGTALGTTECVSDAHIPFDILVVPGSPLLGSAREHRQIVDWLSDAGPDTSRLACISNGAFLLASAGLADRRWLTTHRRDAQRLAAEYPLVHVMPNLACLKDGKLYSSDGANTGIPLALSLVREDLGEHAAEAIATNLLTPAPRSAPGARKSR